MGMLAGIITGALGGGAAAMQQMAQSDIDLEHKQTLADRDAAIREHQMQMQHEMALDQLRQGEQMKMDTANRMRQGEVDRIDKAQAGIVDASIKSKYAGSDAAVADADAGNTDMPLTPEQKAAIAESKGLDRTNGMNDFDTRWKAGVQTGDVSLKDAAALRQKQDHDANWLLAKQNHDDTLAMIAAGHDSTRQMIGAFMAEARGTNNKAQMQLGFGMLQDTSRNIDITRKELKEKQELLLTTAEGEKKQALVADIGELSKQLKNLKGAHDFWSSSLGGKPVYGTDKPESDDKPDPKADGAKPDPAKPDAAPALPKGWTVREAGAKPDSAAKPAPAAAPAPAPAAKPAPAPAPAAPAYAEHTGVLKDQDDRGMTILRGLKEIRDQAAAQLRAAGKSGDTRAVQMYAKQVSEADARLRQVADQSFGNGAEARLAALGT